MAEYIEREALLCRIQEVHCAECDNYHGVRCRACWVDDAMDYINSASAADVVEVVRCRDCVLHGNCLTEDTFNIAMIENPYCCGGKRNG